MNRDYFAEALGAANETEQADFLNAFVRSLSVMCKGSPGGSMSMQAHWVAKLLHADTVRFLKDLVETSEYLQTEYSDAVVAERYECVRRLDEELQRKREELEREP